MVLGLDHNSTKKKIQKRSLLSENQCFLVGTRVMRKLTFPLVVRQSVEWETGDQEHGANVVPGSEETWNDDEGIWNEHEGTWSDDEGTWNDGEGIWNEREGTWNEDAVTGGGHQGEVEAGQEWVAQAC